MVPIVVFAVAALCVGVFFFVRYKNSTRAKFPYTEATPAQGWGIMYSPNMPKTMLQDPSGVYYFDFPDKDGVHYIQKVAPATSQGQKVTMRFTVTGSDGAVIVPTEGDPPARVRLFMQRKGDNLSGAGEYEHYRWWSVDNAVLTVSNNECVLEAAIDPAKWSSVFGKTGDQVPDAFKAAVDNLGVVGFTFGGQFAGHGDFVKGGTARFTLKEYTVA